MKGLILLFSMVVDVKSRMIIILCFWIKTIRRKLLWIILFMYIHSNYQKRMFAKIISFIFVLQSKRLLDTQTRNKLI